MKTIPKGRSLKGYYPVLFFLFISTCFNHQALSQDLTPSHQDSLRQVLHQYSNLNIKIFQSNSSQSNVDELFQLFTDDFVYVHPKYGGTYTRTDLYEGYLNNLQRGAYDGTIVDIKIKNTIIGLNAVAIDRVFLKKSESGDLEEVDPGMTLFEFRNGKISKITEYW